MPAGIEVDPVPRNAHGNDVGRSAGFLPQAQAGEEPRQAGRTGKTDLPGGMALGFEQQEAEDEIPQFLSAAAGTPSRRTRTFQLRGSRLSPPRPKTAPRTGRTPDERSAPGANHLP